MSSLDSTVSSLTCLLHEASNTVAGFHQRVRATSTVPSQSDASSSGLPTQEDPFLQSFGNLYQQRQEWLEERQELLEENARLKTEIESLALQLAAKSKESEDAGDLKAKLESLAAVYKD